jgi:membrane fusion protein, multidrug efflux system
MSSQKALVQATRPALPAARVSKRRLVGIALLVLLLAAGLTAKLAHPAPRDSHHKSEPAMPVAASAVTTGDMPVVINGLGTVTPLATVTVQSQVSGQIVSIPFKEGQNVKRGDPLIEIDPRPFQVALEQAQGALERDRSLLANARIDLNRYETLFKQDSTSQQILATQQALVVQDQGAVAIDQGQIDAAKLNLTYAHIVSPIDGRVGLRQVDLGNYITPAEPNGLLVVTELAPISVVFTVAEDQIPLLMKQLRDGSTLRATAYNRDHSRKLATGTLETVDNMVDPTTGTVKLKAIFPNDDDNLFPDQFVNVELLVDTIHGATLVPDAAVQRGTPGTYVYLIGPDHKVSVRKVTLGPSDATRVSITDGLKPGDRVVVDGVDRLKEGSSVLVRQPRDTT